MEEGAICCFNLHLVQKKYSIPTLLERHKGCTVRKLMTSNWKVFWSQSIVRICGVKQ